VDGVLFLLKKSIRNILYSITGLIFVFWFLCLLVSLYGNYKIIKIAEDLKSYHYEMLKAGQKTLQSFSQVKAQFLLGILEKRQKYFDQIEKFIRKTKEQIQITKELALKRKNEAVLKNLEDLENFLDKIEEYILNKKQSILKSQATFSPEIAQILKEFKLQEKKVKDLANLMLGNRFKELITCLSEQKKMSILALIANVVFFFISIVIAGMSVYFVANGLQKEVKKLEDFAEKIKQRDLTKSLEIPEDSENEIHIIGQKMNQIVANIRELLSEVRDEISQISSGAEEFSVVVSQNVEHAKQAFDNVRDLLKYIEDFKKVIEDLNNALNQLTQAVNEIAKNATETSVESDDANAKMEQLIEVLSMLISEIQAISSSADLIQEIAEKTNLLALNATIEAAHAGDAGRGFAVIAGEIQDLSKTSGRYASEITTKVNSLVNRSKETENTVKTTKEAISRTKERTASVASAVEEQTVVISEIAETLNKVHQEISTLDRIAAEIQQRTEEAEQTNKEITKAAESLAKTAVMLENAITKYKV